MKQLIERFGIIGFYFVKYFLCVCMIVCMGMRVAEHIWRPEDDCGVGFLCLLLHEFSGLTVDCKAFVASAFPAELAHRTDFCELSLTG